MDVQRFEATADTLEVRQLITMRNDSKPPRTLMNDRPFEISLPADAQVESGLVQVENGKPLQQKPCAVSRRGVITSLLPFLRCPTLAKQLSKAAREVEFLNAEKRDGATTSIDEILGGVVIRIVTTSARCVGVTI